MLDELLLSRFDAERPKGVPTATVGTSEQRGSGSNSRLFAFLLHTFDGHNTNLSLSRSKPFCTSVSAKAHAAAGASFTSRISIRGRGRRWVGSCSQTFKFTINISLKSARQAGRVHKRAP